MDLEYLKKYGKIIGVDEAGRGPLAGPVVVGAVLLENIKQLNLLNKISNDSKKMSEKDRDIAFEIIMKNFKYSIKISSPEEIDMLNIFSATTLGIKRALNDFNIADKYVLIDGKNFKLNMNNYECIVKGDSKSKVIGAASILAKVFRDRYMKELDEEFPEYNFKKHKGYPTKEHIENIKKHGVKSFHRITFNPIKKLMLNKEIKFNKNEFDSMRLMRIGL
ncbi:RNase HII [Marinitoga hydrogenitolerans DSM 16785]|uniref:Ribonuclease HII n=1 Tax=Marinitoga hydrogenitolerans (strain DSM 16785 / JCM 12826 / AT1271) TaxID=1122195 RepID=A0A1M4WKW4_MARH1|nr:ribonuclease HII [Marinitoga hydrogenitolerans]SHE81693.1 RNase HII [Marinitoga hydrogenitolerans DSM 16785]